MKNALRLLRAYVFRNRPIYVHFGITRRCNLACRMCQIFQHGNREEEVSVSELAAIFDSLRKAGVVYVSIGGGEPLLREDIAEVVELLARKGFIVRLLTNGTLADEALVAELVRAGLKEVSVSLDTLDQQKLDYICGSPGTGKRILEGIDLFARLIPPRKRLLLLNTVVSVLNITELPQISQFAQRKGYYVSFLPVESDAGSEFTFTQDDARSIDESYDFLIARKKSGRSAVFNSTVFLEKSRHYLKTGSRSWRCDAGRLYFSLNPRGELSPCHLYPGGFSLLQQDVRAVTAGREFKAGRERLIRECVGCMRPCWAEVSLFFRDAHSFLEMVRLRLSPRTPPVVPNKEEGRS